MKIQLTITSLLVNCIIFSVFIIAGRNVIYKYIDNKTDWHYTAALYGTIGFALLLIISLAGIVALPLKRKGTKNRFCKD